MGDLHNHGEFIWHVATTAPVMASNHAVLNAILIGKDFDKPFITMYFSTIGRLCGGKDRADVKRAINNLLDVGVLVRLGEPVRGRGRANTYEIVDVTGRFARWDAIIQGEAPPDNSSSAAKGKKTGGKSRKTGGKSVEKGGTVPPQPSLHISKDDEAAPSRREVNKGAGPQTEEEHRLFDQWLRSEGTFGNAMIALQDWRKKQAA